MLREQSIVPHYAAKSYHSVRVGISMSALAMMHPSGFICGDVGFVTHSFRTKKLRSLETVVRTVEGTLEFPQDYEEIEPAEAEARTWQY